MCIFTGKVESVSKTSIFARRDGRVQLLAYGMSMSSSKDVAMILPIPVAGWPPGDVEFISLEGYPEFFKDMASPWATMADDEPRSFSKSVALKVHKVGCFEASFVPTIRDFDRLDERFRLPQVAAELPCYREYGFVVFKLRSGQHEVHPMAFRFDSSLPERVFFPTVHVHDGGRMPEMATFDHALYAQGISSAAMWESSPYRANEHMNVPKSKDIIDPNQMCLRRVISGTAKNEDIFVQTN